MGIHFVPACCIINNKGERTLFLCVLLCVGHETRAKVSYLKRGLEILILSFNYFNFLFKFFQFYNHFVLL